MSNITTTFVQVIDGVIIQSLGSITVSFGMYSGGAVDVPIETISVNEVQQPIVNKNVDITVPTKTSELEKDDVYTKTEINNKLSAVYKFKGSVLTYDLLPTDAENADVWNVTNGTTPELNGMNYAWNNDLSVWDELGGIIGLATLTENGLLSKEDFAALAALKVHDHTGQVITPDAVILNKQYTDITMVDLPIGAIFYNIDQFCWLLKLSDVNYYNLGEELPILCKNGDASTHLEGTAVYISGGAGQFSVLQRTSSSIGKVNAIATQDVLNTGTGRGYYCFFGQVRKFPYLNVIKSTDNENTWIDGASLYLCSELGKYSTTKEDAPAKSTKIGTITNRNGANITVMFTPEPCESTTDLCDWDGPTTEFNTGNTIPIRGADGVIREILKSDFYAVLDDYFAKLSGGNDFLNTQNFDGRINHKAGEYFYTAASKTADTVNDTRVINSAGVEIHSVCTVSNATKGGGTWAETYRLIASDKVIVMAGKVRWNTDNRINLLGDRAALNAIVGESSCSVISSSGMVRLLPNQGFGLDVLPNGHINTYGGKYHYMSTDTADTINDTRTSNQAGVEIHEVCTLGNATKGLGTWIYGRLKLGMVIETDINEYADNAAALTAGLTAGMKYRTGDLLKIVH